MSTARTLTRSFKVSEMEAIAIDAAAQRAGKTMADFMRDSVLKETNKDPVIDGELKRLGDLVEELRAQTEAIKWEVIGVRATFDKALIVEFDEEKFGKQSEAVAGAFR